MGAASKPPFVFAWRWHLSPPFRSDFGAASLGGIPSTLRYSLLTMCLPEALPPPQHHGRTGKN